MNWLNVIDINTFNDAYLTFVNNYKKVKLDLFYDGVLNGEYKFISLNKFKSMKVENFNYDRLQYNNINDMYPKNDRPRGINDVKSLKYHITTKNSISPVVIIYYKNKYILLDGVHRILASRILNEKIKILLIKLKLD